MTDITDPKIKSIVEQYEKKRVKEKERYERIKETEEFKTQNRERARKHYNNNKEVKKQKYIDNREFMNARSSYYYYKKIDNLETFNLKFPDKVEILKSRNIIV
jgi:hypothetical protein|tara:strand:+ start:533 stop:841 length:309 start_codon:yes stop_codon:yes gene_type:complete